MIVAPWRRPASRAPSSDVTPKPTARRWVAERFSAVAGAGAASWRTAPGMSPPWLMVAAVARAARAAPTRRSRAKAPAAARADGGGAGAQRAGAERAGRMPGRVEEQHRHLDRGDPVDQRVVGLAHHRPAAAAQAADEVHAPQRMGLVQRRGEQRPRKLAQLARPGGPGQRHGVDVMGDVEAGVVGPVRVAQAEARTRDAPAEARHVLQAPLDVAAQRRQRGGRALDEDRPAHVQRRLGAVEVEEG